MITVDDPRHGTSAGYVAEQKAGQPHCGACKKARANYQRLRDYDQQLGRPRTVPSIGARRRVRALQRLGWSLTMIAHEAGWNSAEALQYVMRSPSITRRSWTRIHNVYERLSMTIPPYNSATARARLRAERMGYPPPLAWSSIDDPNEEPRGYKRAHDLDRKVPADLTSVDPVAIDRILAGEWRLPCTPAEKTLVCMAWVESGRSITELARLTHWRVTRYYQKDAA